MRETPTQTQSRRRYLIEFGLANLGYAVVLLASNFWLQSHPDSSWGVAVATAPLIPVVLVLWAVVRYFHRMDEWQRQMQRDILAFSFAGTALFVITYGFLEGAGFPTISMWWVWGVMASLWLIGSYISWRRHC